MDSVEMITIRFGAGKCLFQSLILSHLVSPPAFTVNLKETAVMSYEWGGPCTQGYSMDYLPAAWRCEMTNTRQTQVEVH